MTRDDPTLDGRRIGRAGQTRIRRWRPMVVVAVMVVVAGVSPLGPPAAADTSTVRGGCGGGGRWELAIRWARQAHAGRRVVHALKTCDPWEPQAVGRGSWMFFGFDVAGKRKSWRRVEVRHSERRGLYARFYGRGELRVDLPVRRPDRRTVRVAIPLRLLGDGVDRYRWHVVTGSWENCKPRQVSYVCSDWVPGGFRPGVETIRHDLR